MKTGNSYADWRKIAVPKRLAGLPTDPRGYPIPASVITTPDGVVQFAVSDHEAILAAIENNTCALCAQKLYPKRRWLVGGVLAAFHPMGAYLDPPMHEECARYALQVCPYLAAPSYGKRIDDRKIDYDTVDDDFVVIAEPTMVEDRPDLFVLTATDHVDVSFQGAQHYIHPRKPWKAIEFWRNGVRIPDAEGLAIAQKTLSEST